MPDRLCRLVLIALTAAPLIISAGYGRAAAQDRAADVRTAFARAQHLRHGINASEWFAQSAAITQRRAPIAIPTLRTLR